MIWLFAFWADKPVHLYSGKPKTCLALNNCVQLYKERRVNVTTCLGFNWFLYPRIWAFPHILSVETILWFLGLFHFQKDVQEKMMHFKKNLLAEYKKHDSDETSSSSPPSSPTPSSSSSSTPDKDEPKESQSGQQARYRVQSNNSLASQSRLVSNNSLPDHIITLKSWRNNAIKCTSHDS